MWYWLIFASLSGKAPKNSSFNCSIQERIDRVAQEIDRAQQSTLGLPYVRGVEPFDRCTFCKTAQTTSEGHFHMKLRTAFVALVASIALAATPLSTASAHGHHNGGFNGAYGGGMIGMGGWYPGGVLTPLVPLQLLLGGMVMGGQPLGFAQGLTVPYGGYMGGYMGGNPYGSYGRPYGHHYNPPVAVPLK